MPRPRKNQLRNREDQKQEKYYNSSMRTKG